MLSWEYPPRIVGGIAPHVYNLSRALSHREVDTYVVTCDFPGTLSREEIDGTHVFRVDSYKNPSPDFASWIYLMNINMQKEAAEIISNTHGSINLIHAHDWLVADAVIGLKHIFRIPLVVTFHSTEIGRRNGLHTTYQRMIHETEVWLAHEAWKVLCCSNYMASHLSWAFGLPREKIEVIPNGVDVSIFDNDFDKTQLRSKYALPEEKLVLFVGRLVHEKGVHVLINSIPGVLAKVNAKFVIVGEGYMKDALQGQVRSMGLSHKVLFAGFLDEQSLHSLYKCADVCVVPSLYEPFGITALEAMAAQVPVVVSDVGGLSEIVEHDKTGVKIYPNNPSSLAWGITRVLLDTAYAKWIQLNAYQKALETYSWDKISDRTKNFYQKILEEYNTSSWKPT